MIIFDLDGTLADCEHRRHFVDPKKSGAIEFVSDNGKVRWGWGYQDGVFQEWRPNWPAFYEACDKDEPIESTINLLNILIRDDHEIRIWSGRCESVRDKTISWLKQQLDVDAWFYRDCLKMRPIGDNTPDDILKECWLNERCADLITAQIEGRNPSRHDIQFVFDDRKKVIEMWRRRGIFVFDVSQGKGDF